MFSSLEFVAYFFDRFSRASDLKEQVTTLTNQKDAIYNDHAAVQENYNQVCNISVKYEFFLYKIKYNDLLYLGEQKYRTTKTKLFGQ